MKILFQTYFCSPDIKQKQNKTKQTSLPESTSELYQPSDLRFSAHEKNKQNFCRETFKEDTT
jgi:hypothetical protein